MERKEMVVGVVVFVVVVIILIFWGMSNEDVLDEDGVVDSATVGVNIVPPGESVEVVGVDWERYNYDFVDEEVKRILSSMITGKKTAFYLPPVGYINVSRGSKFGVAFALNNPNPSGENMFEYEWTVDGSVVESCGVSVVEGQSWIERGWMSWGKIPKGWVDHMTVYFAFPENAPLCNVKYNFEIRKDGAVYDTKVLEFNIV
jgi:hypothetical protein